MTIIADTVVILVALLHTYFFAHEIFLWDKPAGKCPTEQNRATLPI